MTKLHPFDFANLQKGTWIDTEELEAAAVTSRNDPAFPLRVLGLKDAIEARTGILSRIEGQRLRLMSDGEAVIWTVKQAADASRKLERNARRLSENIESANLSPTELVVHEHAQRVVSLMADSQREIKKRNARLFLFARAALPDFVEDDE